jgi:endogenous inhibitor of DNA gyrase (YacG/DUF329 family)
MVIECPHCFTKVIADNNHICPSCGKNVNEIDIERSSKTSCVIQYNDNLPKYCIHCGKSTSDIVKFETDIEGGNSDKKFILYNLLIMILSFLAVFTGWLILAQYNKNVQNYLLHYPICDSCKNAKLKLEIKNIDFKNERITVIVNKVFKNEFEASKR